MQEIKYYKETVFKPKSKQDWDKRDQDFDKHYESPYYDEIFSRINLENVESILDVGCGNGNLQIFIKSKRVVGLDYSDGMIQAFKKNIKNYKNTKIIKKAWEEDWNDVDVYDIAVVSKSFEFERFKFIRIY